MSNFAGTCIQGADFLLQSYFCLVREVFAENPTAGVGAGVYTAADWSENRQRLTVPFGAVEDRYGSDANYLRYLAAIDASKIRPVRSLTAQFDFSGFGRILELGCGDMPQAYTICTKYPGIRYTASDFDPQVIAQCSRVPLLAGIRKSVLDVVNSDLDDHLKNQDLVLSWSLEFALDDRQLTRLFAACKKHAVPYLLCTHTAIGPIGYLSTAWSSRAQRREKGKPRLIGWLRSVGEIARLAAQAGMTLQWKAYHVNHIALYFSTA